MMSRPLIPLSPKNEQEYLVCNWLRENDKAGLEQAYLVIVNESNNCLSDFDVNEIISIFQALQPRINPMSDAEIDELASMFSSIQF